MPAEPEPQPTSQPTIELPAESGLLDTSVQDGRLGQILVSKDIDALIAGRIAQIDEILSRMGVELKSQKLGDFQPDLVARQVGQLIQLLELRTKLLNLRSSLNGNDKLQSLLLASIAETESARKGKTEGAEKPKQES